MYPKIKALTAFFVLALVVLNYTIYGQHHHHAHNDAQATIVIENNSLTIDLALPATLLLNFERPAKTEPERKAIQAALNQLQSTHAITLHTSPSWFKKNTTINLNSANSTCTFHYDLHHQHSELKCKTTGNLKNPHEISSLSSELFTEIPKLASLDLTLIIDEHVEQLTLSKSRSKKTLGKKSND